MRLALFALALLAAPAAAADKPNVVFLLADDLGYGDLGCFGSTKIRTPAIDKLAAGGMKLTNHYAGCNVCAPSRCVLMTGLHTGHAFIRDNVPAKGFPEGQTPVPAGTLKLPLALHAAGYTVGGFGKWGLGPVGSTGDPLKQGFDRFYGFNCQAVAHNSYPTYLWDDSTKVALKNDPKITAHPKAPPATADPADPKLYEGFIGTDYAPDLIAAKAREFVTANKDKPFFLYYPTTVPHLALQVPDDASQEYDFSETPYPGGRGYTPHPRPRAAYAGMVTRMDREIDKLLDLLDELKLADNTFVIFTSDNGPLYDKLGGTDSDFFNSAAGMRGRKGSNYEGGLRVPCVVRWPGHIAAGSSSDRVTGFEDWLPTLLDLTGNKAATPAGIDGIDFAPTLLGQTQPPREFLYRESPGYGGQQSVRAGNWKAVHTNLNPRPKAKDAKPGPLELYDLAADPAETTNVAAKHPEVATRMQALLTREHTPSKEFPTRALDGK
jgi:arylsulfatase A